MSERERSRYRLISADSHVNEPGDLWTARVPKQYADRAPRIESFEQGDAWVLDGVSDPINFGMNACAGLPPEQMTGWKRFDEIRRGGYDPAARLEEMDQDGVDAEVLYPTPRLSQAVFAYTDPDFHHALVRAYNDWLAEYVAYAPDRFAGLAMLPNRGCDGAVAEAKRVQDLPGIRGVVMGCYPNGTLSVEPEDDAVFGYLAEADIPLSIHVSLTQALPSAHRSPLPGYGRFFDAPNRIVEMIFAGVFDRFPGLSVVIAEVDCGWVPYFKEQIDNNYRRLDAVSNFTIDDLPSAYVERNVHFTFITDTFGVRSRHDVGVENMLWSSDYPHISADWPYSWRSIQAAMSGVPHDEREQLLAGNAVRLYNSDDALMTLVTTSLDDHGVMLVTLDDPERYNALSSAMVSDLKSAFGDIRANRAVRAVIVTGAGRGFCSGANMAGGDDVPESARDRGPVGLVQMFQEHIAELMLAVHELPQPVIAAVHGAAVGGGLALALASDLRVASPDAFFASHFIRVGLSSCDVGTSYLLPRIVGATRAAELMLTGRRFAAEEADRFGMLNRLVPREELLDAARDLAGAVIANSEFGVYMTKLGLWANLDASSLRAAMELENRTQVLGTFTGNMAEAGEAFREKRDPVWKPM